MKNAFFQLRKTNIVAVFCLTAWLAIAGKTFAVTQLGGCPTVTVDPPSIPAATAGTDYAQTLQASDGGIVALSRSGERADSARTDRTQRN